MKNKVFTLKNIEYILITISLKHSSLGGSKL